MAKKKSASKKKQTRTAGKRPNAARPSGQKRTGMDRFAVPAGTQTERQAARAPAAPAPSGQTERKPSARRQSAGMQVQVGDPGRRMRPQKAAVTTATMAQPTFSVEQRFTRIMVQPETTSSPAYMKAEEKPRMELCSS